MYICGQLGQGHNEICAPNIVKVQHLNDIIFLHCAGGATSVVDSQNNVFSFGGNNRGQLGVGDEEDRNTPTLIEALRDIKITSVSSSNFHSMFLSEDGHVYVCGGNEKGKLGFRFNLDVLKEKMEEVGENLINSEILLKSIEINIINN